MRAKLIRYMPSGKNLPYWDKYIYECIDCGAEYSRSACNVRISPYCGDCQRKRDKERAKARKAEKAIKHDAEMLQDFAQWLWNSHYLVDEAFSIRLVDQYKDEKRKEQNNG